MGTQCEPMGLMLCMGQIIKSRPAGGAHDMEPPPVSRSALFLT